MKFSRAGAGSPARHASTMARIWSPAAWPSTETTPHAAVREPAQGGDVVAGVDRVAQLPASRPAGEVSDGVLDRDDGPSPRRPHRSRARWWCRCARGRRTASPARRWRGPPAEVVQDAGLARLVVVRRDQEQPVGAELLGLAGQLDRVRGGVGADPGDDVARSPTASLTARRMPPSSATLVVGDSPVVPETTTPSWPWSTRCAAIRAVPSRSTEPSSWKAVAIAVSTRPKGAEGVVVAMGSGYRLTAAHARADAPTTRSRKPSARRAVSTHSSRSKSGYVTSPAGSGAPR